MYRKHDELTMRQGIRLYSQCHGFRLYTKQLIKINQVKRIRRDSGIHIYQAVDKDNMRELMTDLRIHLAKTEAALWKARRK
jgi:hypothetical protein